MRRRHRHGPYGVERSRRRFRFLRPLLLFGCSGLAVFYVGSWLINTISFGGSGQNTSIALALEDTGIVNVSLDGAEWKRVSTDMKLYPGDKVATEGASNVALRLFDGSTIRLAEDSSLSVLESKSDTEQASFSLHLERGTMWMQTPTLVSYSGSITRLVSTDRLSSTFLANTQAVLSETELSVFEGEGEGSTVHVAGATDPIIIGEGQKIALPEGDITDPNLYAYRSPLGGEVSTFVASSREANGVLPSRIVAAGTTTTTTEDDVITIASPAENEVITASTVLVEGSIQPRVNGVRVNGYQAQVDSIGNSYSIELALPEKESITITAEALGNDGTILDQVRTEISRNLAPPDPAKITEPVSTGGTYKTEETRLEIVGEAPADSVGIIVNDYRLQFFTPGDKEWKYLAATTLDNLQEGENTFEVISINSAGQRSEPVNITVILGQGGEGVVEGGEDGEEEGEVVEPVDLPNNAPLSPGSLRVTGPGDNPFNTNEIEHLIEGLAPSGTQSIWVNDYRLQLFKPEKGLWNYIASTKLNTMKRGANTYTITARNADYEIIDQVDYTINFNPRGR